MGCVSLYGWKFCYFPCWIIRLNITKIYWINEACYGPNLLYGDAMVWLEIFMLHMVLHKFSHI